MGRLSILPSIMLALLAMPTSAAAHDTRPGAVALREVAPQTFAIRVTRARGPTGPPIDPAPVWPPSCAPTADRRLTCDGGLSGPLALPGLERADVECLVAVRWLDGARFEALLHSRHPQTTISRAAPNPAERGWITAGIEHIVFGPDHLLFVLGLGLLVRRRRSLLIAITGFTIAHSLTLAAAALGWLAPAGSAIELLIAASVLLLAAEAARAPDTAPPLTARRPLLLVLPFGLLHGLGFAAPLIGLGLPPDGALMAIAGFNIGVEVGQLAVLALALGALHLAPAIRRPAAYLTGVVAGYWTVDRGLAWLTQLYG